MMCEKEVELECLYGSILFDKVDVLNLEVIFLVIMYMYGVFLL